MLSNKVTSLRGSVDWNSDISKIRLGGFGHFPQGKCGLKCYRIHTANPHSKVTSLRGSVDWNHQGWHEKALPACHFPQGKCGLKSVNRLFAIRLSPVTSLRGSVDWNLAVLGDQKHGTVTSLRGSVDWNREIANIIIQPFGHFPQGKCGLKFLLLQQHQRKIRSLPSGEVWIEMYVVWYPIAFIAMSLPSGEVWIEIILSPFNPLDP